MIADIYRTRRTNTFILVPSGSTLAGVREEVISELGDATFLNTRNLKDTSLGIDAQGIISALKTQGFSVYER